MTSEELNMYIDYMDEDGNKESHDYNLHLLQQYYTCEDITDNGYSLEEAELKILGGSRRIYPMRAIENVLKIFYKKMGSSTIRRERLEELVVLLEKITGSEYSKETKVSKIRRTLAVFGVRNNIDSYLFEEINDMMQERLTAIKSYGRKKGL